MRITRCASLVAALWLLYTLAIPQDRLQEAFRASTESLGRDVKVNWAVGYIEARGEGVYPEGYRPAQARLMARRAAIVDAQRNLLESVKGVRVTAETRVRNFIVASDEVKSQVEGVIKGAIIVSEKDKGNSYEVIMRAPLNGIASEAIQALKDPDDYGITPEEMRRLNPPQTKVDIPTSPPSPPAPSIVADASKPYTGVIVDARGLGIQPCMSPKIRREDGSEVWGTLQVSPETALEYGIAAWLRDTKDLDHPLIRKRIGTNPMFIRAIGVAGAGKGDAVLKAEDAQRLLDENRRGENFLDKLSVVILY